MTSKIFNTFIDLRGSSIKCYHILTVQSGKWTIKLTLCKKELNISGILYFVVYSEVLLELFPML